MIDVPVCKYCQSENVIKYGKYKVTVYCGLPPKIEQNHPVGFMDRSDKTGHPAPFPEQLANDYIISWSKEGDTVLDPMCGSGTTLKMALLNNRRAIGIDVSAEYCALSVARCLPVMENREFDAFLV